VVKKYHREFEVSTYSCLGILGIIEVPGYHFRSFFNFFENTVVDERNLLEKWGYPHGMME
jgi:hypothetical protein